jgi:hypothetical protein
VIFQGFAVRNLALASAMKRGRKKPGFGGGEPGSFTKKIGQNVRREQRGSCAAAASPSCG